MMASSAHLTRTSHHNNPVDNFGIAEKEFFTNPKLGGGKAGQDQEMQNGDSQPPKEILRCAGCEKAMEKSYEASKYITV